MQLQLDNNKKELKVSRNLCFPGQRKLRTAFPL